MLNINISGPHASGKTWAALIIKAAFCAAGMEEISIKLLGEDITESAKEERYRHLYKGFQPLEGKVARITQTTVSRESEGHKFTELPDPLTEGYVLRHLESRLGNLGSDLIFLIGITPTGAKRDHLTDLNIHLLSAIDALRKAQGL